MLSGFFIAGKLNVNDKFAATIIIPERTHSVMHQLILFASGNGSNVQAIIDFFAINNKAKAALIVCNKPDAGVLKIAERHNVPTLIIDKVSFREPEFVAHIKSYAPSLLVLAGFLWKIPETVVQSFPDKIINIHPALLPKYGGKGMYGSKVHQAVVAAQEKESGITIHYVNEHYDEGATILQAHCALTQKDSHESLASKIHQLEHYYYPRAIEFLLNKM